MPLLSTSLVPNLFPLGLFFIINFRGYFLLINFDLFLFLFSFPFSVETIKRVVCKSFDEFVGVTVQYLFCLCLSGLDSYVDISFNSVFFLVRLT